MALIAVVKLFDFSEFWILVFFGLTSYSRLHNGPPKHAYVLSPGIFAYVTLHGKRDYVDVLKLTILTLGDYPGLSEWVQLPRSIYEGCNSIRVREREDRR